MTQYFAIGMAGHIDHGKTTLTKALTGIDTDRLKEEKERKISIEPGFALFHQDDDLEVSIIDVPGHERFIRQMIAGVAGIDYVLLVIAADEGIMPQTIEHVQILSLLGIAKGMIVLTKRATVEKDFLMLVERDVREQLRGTFLEDSYLLQVDSMTGEGIDALKMKIYEEIDQLPPKERERSFRLPIDHVFTVKGQGVVVRGTVADGEARVGDLLYLFPQEKEVRIRKIQRHYQEEKSAHRGQRAALNLHGVHHREIHRGDILVAEKDALRTRRIDVSIQVLPRIKYPIKQRQFLKIHIGTKEVMGKIIMFDRNTLHPSKDLEEVFCQLELEEPIVVFPKDRFIVRRPTPVETIGGGIVIDPIASKHSFGKETVLSLQKKKEGRPIDRVTHYLRCEKLATKEQIFQHVVIDEAEWREVKKDLVSIGDKWTMKSILNEICKRLLEQLKEYHLEYPLRAGIDRAELFSLFQSTPSLLMEYVLDQLEKERKIVLSGHYIACFHHTRGKPKEWEKELTQIEQQWIEQELDVQNWHDIACKSKIPEDIMEDFYHYLVSEKIAYVFDEKRIVSAHVVQEKAQKLKEGTRGNSFTLQEARDILGLSRKNLIPFLELLDQLGLTKRVENERFWREN